MSFLNLTLLRLEIRQQVQWGWHAETEAAEDKIQHLWNALAPLLEKLMDLQTVAGISNAVSCSTQPDDGMIDWEEIVETVNEETSSAPRSHYLPAGPQTEDLSSPELAEMQALHLPSNGNVSPCPVNVELTLCKHQTQTHLSHLHDLIANKSFQFSLVIHMVPQKSIRTKGRATMKGFNAQITFHSQLYSHS